MGGRFAKERPRGRTFTTTAAMGRAATAWDRAAESALENVTTATHARFLEIGTSDFNALGPTMRPPGISVEAIGAYQKRLFKNGVPAGVRAVNAAVILDAACAAGASNATFFFVAPEDIEAHRLPDTIRGMSSLNRPSKEALGLLGRRNLAHLMRKQAVPTTSYTRLAQGISALGFLKLDVEGGEGAILRDVVGECVTRNLCPAYIKYERVHMPKSHRSEAKRALGSLNYTLLESCSDPGGAWDCRFTRLNGDAQPVNISRDGRASYTGEGSGARVSRNG